MKPVITLLFLLSILLNCNRFEAEYDVNCIFDGQFFSQNAKLLVVDYSGDVLGVFKLSNAGSFAGKVSTRDSHAPDYYDLHLIIHDSLFNNTQVYSSLGVKNGALAYLGGKQGSNIQFDALKTFFVADIHSLEKASIVGWFEQPNFFPASQSVTSRVRIVNDQSVLLKMRANGESQDRSLFIPSDVLLNANDTLFFSWNDFKPEGNFQPVTIEGQTPDDWYVIATDKDHKHLAFLYRHDPANTSGLFSIPDGLPMELNHLSVYAQRGNTAYEKIFTLGSPLQFGPPNMAIDSWDMRDGKMQISTSGAVELVHLTVTQNLISPSGFGGFFFWQISGAPNDFAERKRPDLEQWLPDWINLSKAFERGSIQAYHFDLYDDSDIKAGFPFRSNERFAYAHVGTTIVSKNY